MDLLIIGVLIAIFITFVGIAIAFVSFRVFRGDQVSTRLQEYVVAPSATGWVRAEVEADPDLLKGSLLKRTFSPIFHRIISFLGKLISLASVEQLNWKLSIIRNPTNLKALEFNGLRLIVFLMGIGLAVFIYLGGSTQNRLNLLGALGVLLISLMLPEVWLNSQVRKAQTEARAGLPDALDMLSVCAYAGLGFDQSLQRVSEYWQTTLGNEFRRVVNELELGVSRTDALRHLSDRLKVPELSTFVTIIIQADLLGMPIADVLHGQAEQMRHIRQFKAKEGANRLPAKMIIPLAFLILPALLAVIFAPIIPSLLGLFGGF